MGGAVARLTDKLERADNDLVEMSKLGKIWVKPFKRTRGGKVQNVDGYWRTAKPGEKAHAFIDESIMPKGMSHSKLTAEEALKYGLVPPGQDVPATPAKPGKKAVKTGLIDLTTVKVGDRVRVTTNRNTATVEEIHPNSLGLRFDHWPNKVSAFTALDLLEHASDSPPPGRVVTTTKSSPKWLKKVDELIGYGIEDHKVAIEVGEIVWAEVKRRREELLAEKVEIDNPSLVLAKGQAEKTRDTLKSLKERFADKPDSEYFKTSLRLAEDALAENLNEIDRIEASGEFKLPNRTIGEHIQWAKETYDKDFKEWSSLGIDLNTVGARTRMAKDERTFLAAKALALPVGDPDRAKLQASIDDLDVKLKEYEGESLRLIAQRDALKSRWMQARLLQTKLLDRGWAAAEDAYVDVLSQVRPMGGGPDQPYAKGSHKAAKAAIDEIRKFFPTEWLEASAGNNTMLVKSSRGRGQYGASGYGNFGENWSRLLISNTPGSRAYLSTAVHELAHRMEHVTRGRIRTVRVLRGGNEVSFPVPREAEMPRLQVFLGKLTPPSEKWLREAVAKGWLPSEVLERFVDGDEAEGSIFQFYSYEKSESPLTKLEGSYHAARTGSNPLKWLGAGYKKHEKYKESANGTPWTNNYIGKEYEDDYREILTMGMQSLVTGGEKYDLAAKDPELLYFVFGLVAGVRSEI